MSINTTNLNNLNSVSLNSGSAQADLIETDLSSNKNKINNLKSDIISANTNAEKISMNTGATVNINSSGDDIVSAQEKNFLNSYKNGDLNKYDPRAIVIAGQYILAQSEDKESRLETGDNLLDITGVYDVNRATGLNLIHQAKEIIDKTEVTGKDTSKQFGADMQSLFFSYVGNGSTDNKAKPIDSDALNTVFNITDTFKTLDGGDKVIIVGGWNAHSLGDLVGDAGGISGLDNNLGTRNGDTSNDALFKSIYDKMSQEDKDRLATTPTIIDAQTGKIIGEIDMADLVTQDAEPVSMNWGDYGAQNDGYNWNGIRTESKNHTAEFVSDMKSDSSAKDNSIEGQTISYKGKEYNVVDSTFRWASPIILDLDGDGIQLTSAEDGTVFDLDGDGKKDKTAWTKSGQGFDDAFLVLDRDKNGSIDSGKELFGDQHGAANGYDELAKLDSNKDGKIDKDDTAYTELKLWADIDGDGQSDEGELKTLAEMGVTSISTKYSGSKGSEFDEHGNDISLESSFTRVVDGEEKTLQSIDAFFVNRDATKAESIDLSSLDSLTSGLLEAFKEFADVKKDTYVPPSKNSDETADATGSETEAQTELEKELESEKKVEERRQAFVSSQIDSAEGEKSSLESDLSLAENELSTVESAPKAEEEVIISNEHLVSSEDSEVAPTGVRTGTVRASDDSNSANKASAQSKHAYLSSQISSKDSEISRLRASI